MNEHFILSFQNTHKEVIDKLLSWSNKKNIHVNKTLHRLLEPIGDRWNTSSHTGDCNILVLVQFLNGNAIISIMGKMSLIAVLYLAMHVSLSEVLHWTTQVSLSAVLLQIIHVALSAVLHRTIYVALSAVFPV